MTVSDVELSQQLTEAIVHRIPTIFGDGYELSSVPPLRLDRRYSFMFRYWLKNPDGTTSTLLVKIPHEDDMVTMQQAIDSSHIRDVILAEFESMNSIAIAISESGNSRLFAIRPRAALPEFNALLMDEFAIRMLKTSLARPAIMLGSQKEWQELESQLNLAGEWLKVIHAGYNSGQATTFQALKMQEKMETELEILEGFLSKPLSDVRNLFLQLYAFLKDIEVPLACLHNDYHLGNIFVTEDGRVGALDPNWEDGGSIYQDLSTLIVYPVARKAQVLSQGLAFRPSLQKRYERAVLQGYFGASERPDPMLDTYCALAVLTKWIADEELMKSSGSGLFRASSLFITPLIRRYFHRTMQYYLRRGIESVRGLKDPSQR